MNAHRYLMLYFRPLEFEAKRFLSGACCHAHAMHVYRDWLPVRELVIPRLRDGTYETPNNVNVTAVVGTTIQILKLHMETPSGVPLVDGTVIDSLYALYGGDETRVMHDFVRMPLLPIGEVGSWTKRKAANNKEIKINVWRHSAATEH